MVDEGPNRLEQPRQCSSQFGRIVVGLGHVTLDVLDGALDDVDRVTKFVELSSGDDQLGFTEAELGRSLTLEVGHLAATRLAELPRPARTVPCVQWAPAPRAFGRTCHPADITSIDVIPW